MSEAARGPGLEHVRVELVDVKGDLQDRRDHAEVNLAISALDVAQEVDGPLREWALRDCQHHCRALGERIDDPGAAGALVGTARMLEEVIGA